MVDSNIYIYIEKILPSEKAFAYKMKMDVIKYQGKATSDTKEHLVDNTVKYDKRTYLTIGIKLAVELSYFNKMNKI